MEVQKIEIDCEEARELYRSYREHVHYSKPIDDEIGQAYRLLSKGQLVIRAIDSVVKAGVNNEGFPKLALCRSDAEQCELCLNSDGSAVMQYVGPSFRYNQWQRQRFEFGPGSFPVKAKGWWRRHALVPTIPLHLRPQRGRENYHILWEADWQPVVSRDPYLLRRIGKSDMWLVVAMWELSEVERTALQARVTVQ